MADANGFLGGLGSGLSSFADAYSKQKQLNTTNAINQKYADIAQQKADEGSLTLKSGLIKNNQQLNPETNELELNDLGQQQQKTDLAKAQETANSMDPNSDYAKSHRSSLRAQIEKVIPGASNQIYPDQMSPYEFETSKTSELIKPIIEANAKSAGMSTKHDDKINRGFNDMGTVMDPNKGKAGNLAVLQARLNQADRIDELVKKSNENPEGLTGAEMRELATTTQALLSSGGHPAEAGIEGLIPHTWYGKAQSLAEYLSNAPKGLGNQKFVDNYKNLIDRERHVTEKQLEDAQYANASRFSYLEKEDPQRFKDLVNTRGDYDKYKAWQDARGVGKGSSGKASGQGLLQPLGSAAPAAPSAPQTKGPPPGTIVGDHKFLGGDPNDKNSWAPLNAGK